MRVEDLIEELKCLPMDAEVHFQYNYGDHWRTQVAPTVDSVETGFVKYSDYHRMHKVAELDYDEDDNPVVDAKQVVLLRVVDDVITSDGAIVAWLLNIFRAIRSPK